MKYIVKNAPPDAWVKHNDPAGWVDQDGNPMNWTYDQDVPSTLKRDLKACLISEQGGICGYTGWRIFSEESHVEHLKPQNQCEHHEDVDYNNVIAAYPYGDCEFGAKKKGGWYDGALFISPLIAKCETAFIYSADGDVFPSDNNDLAAIKTIEVLFLKAPRLRRMRSNVIEAVFEQELSIDEISQYISALEQRDESGFYVPFCFVIKQVLNNYLLQVR